MPMPTAGGANRYSRRWFEVFLDSIPDEWTRAELDGVRRRLPLPDFAAVLDVCCGPGRHARHLVAAGYAVTGVDRDPVAVAHARAAAPGGRFVRLDQRGLGQLPGRYDAVVVLWQSFGYFDPSTNDGVLSAIAARLRPGGRLLIDLFHPGWFRANQGRRTDVRDPRCRAITNEMRGTRLRSTIEYVDGAIEVMDFELFEPDQLADRAAAAAALREVERCCWWDEARVPTAAEQRYQMVLERP